MKHLTVLTLIIGSITLLPSASFADNVTTSSQEIYQHTTIGNGPIVKSNKRQSVVSLRKYGYRNNKSNRRFQRINIKTTTVGDGQVNIKTTTTGDGNVNTKTTTVGDVNVEANTIIQDAFDRYHNR